MNSSRVYAPVMPPHKAALYDRRDGVAPWPTGPAWEYDDGGRAAAGFRGDAGDCVTRAVAIATGRPYREVYDELAALMASTGEPRSARNGISKKVTRAYLAALGWTWWPTMKIGSGCQVHLDAAELPAGRLVCQLSKHVVAVVDGTVRDTYDPTREGTRCVYGYWTPPALWSADDEARISELRETRDRELTTCELIELRAIRRREQAEAFRIRRGQS